MVIGKLVITLCNQAGAAPLLDYCRVQMSEGDPAWGRCLLLTPWKRNRFGESLAQTALVVAWRSKLPGKWASPSRKEQQS